MYKSSCCSASNIIKIMCLSGSPISSGRYDACIFYEHRIECYAMHQTNIWIWTYKYRKQAPRYMVSIYFISRSSIILPPPRQSYMYNIKMSKNLVAKRGPGIGWKPEEPSKKDDIRKKEKLYFSRGLSSHAVVVVRAESATRGRACFLGRAEEHNSGQETRNGS